MIKMLKQFSCIFKYLKICIIKNTRLFFVFLFQKLLSNAHVLFWSVFFIHKISEYIENDSPTHRIILFIVVSIISFAALKLISLIIETYTIPLEKLRFINNSNIKWYELSTKVKLECFEQPEFYDRYTFGIRNYANNVLNLIDIISDIVTNIVVSIVLISYINHLSLFIIAISLISLFSGFYFGGKINTLRVDFRMNNEINNRKGEYIKRLIYLKEYAIDIKTSNLTNLIKTINKDRLFDFTNLSKKYHHKIFKIRGIQEIISQYIVYFSTLIFCVLNIYGSNIGVFELLPQVNATMQFSIKLYAFSSLYNRFIQYITELEKIKKFIDDDTLIQQSGEYPLLYIETVEFKNVTFSYGQVSVLKNVSFTIKAKEKICILGYNGSGKTTLLKLLLRFYECDSGEILINNQNINKYKITDLYKCITPLFQDYNIYSFNVIHNIVMDSINAAETIKKSKEAINYVELGHLESIYPNFLNKHITKEYYDNGIELSGGQLERLALSRIYMKDGVIVLDEPTKALDPISEDKVMNRIFEYFQNNIVIFVTHKLSTCKYADKILFFKDGCLIEYGSHDYLMKKGGNYFELMNKTFLGDEKKEEDIC